MMKGIRIGAPFHFGFLKDVVLAHDAAVFTDGVNIKDLIYWNNVCRSNSKASLDARGQPTTVPAPVLFIW